MSTSLFFFLQRQILIYTIVNHLEPEDVYAPRVDKMDGTYDDLKENINLRRTGPVKFC